MKLNSVNLAQLLRVTVLYTCISQTHLYPKFTHIQINSTIHKHVSGKTKEGKAANGLFSIL